MQIPNVNRGLSLRIVADMGLESAKLGHGDAF
jgi:hypothetical protein